MKPTTKTPPAVRTKKPKRKRAHSNTKPTPEALTSSASKLDRMVASLRRPKGASIFDLMKLTGWQMHSVRGAIAGTLKKRRKLDVTYSKADGGRTYRIAGRA